MTGESVGELVSKWASDQMFSMMTTKVLSELDVAEWVSKWATVQSWLFKVLMNKWAIVYAEPAKVLFSELGVVEQESKS